MTEATQTVDPVKKQRTKGCFVKNDPRIQRMNKGRPKGTKDTLGKAFFKDLAARWEKSGPSVLERMARNEPGTFLRVVASLMPKQLDITGEVTINHEMALRSANDRARAALESRLEPKTIDHVPG